MRRLDGSSGRSARWPQSGSSTARTRPVSAATSSTRRPGRRGWGGRGGWGPARGGGRGGWGGGGPEPVVVNGNAETDDEREAGREKILKRFEEIGLQIMRR